MSIRIAQRADAAAIAEIYAPIVRDTAISFEVQPPTAEDMAARISATLRTLPWLVSVDASGSIDGYAYASKHRERQAYRWSVDSTVYVRADRRGQGVGKRLYFESFETLARLGYCEVFAGIALPNDASVALHRSVGFEPIGTYRRVGFKHGLWYDVSWWQRSIRDTNDPADPEPFGG